MTFLHCNISCCIIIVIIIVSLQVILAVASMSDKMDVSSKSLTSKDSETAAESLSAMNDATQPQVQSMDTSCDPDGGSGSANFDHAGDKGTRSKPVGSESCMSCQSVPSSADVEMQSCPEESSQRVDIGSKDITGQCDDELNEEEFRSVKRKEEETAAVCVSVDDGKLPVCEITDETEAMSTVVQPSGDEAASNVDKQQSEVELTVQLAADADSVPSSEATPSSGKDVTNSNTV